MGWFTKLAGKSALAKSKQIIQDFMDAHQAADENEKTFLYGAALLNLPENIEKMEFEIKSHHGWPIFEKIFSEKKLSGEFHGKYWKEYSSGAANFQYLQKHRPFPDFIFWSYRLAEAYCFIIACDPETPDRKKTFQTLKTLFEKFENGIRDTIPAPSGENEPRRTIIACPSCSQSIRVPIGKSGRLRCPKCQNSFHADTH